MSDKSFSHEEALAQRFAHQGYLVLPKMAPLAMVEGLRALALEDLQQSILPVEYEAQTHYPGAPASLEAVGGKTVRRLLQAYARDERVRAWARFAPLIRWLEKLMAEPVLMSQAHHNCIMTKNPHFSSLTQWHQDIRYWRFERPELISTWLALGEETLDNGCLQVIPGSHLMSYQSEQFDKEHFVRDDLPQNQALIHTSCPVPLEAGDVLLFHCRLFHAASANHTEQTKLSLVHTYHGVSNPACEGTRSAQWTSIAMRGT